MLIHRRWGGLPVVEDAIVLDAFAGSGALGLEALSRGAAQATFMENDRAALVALRANIAACGAADRSRVLAVDVLTAPWGSACGLVFLDPPYGAALIPQAVARLRASGWIAPHTVVVAETGHAETLPALGALLAERAHGTARVSIWRETG
jgi:16S rRNA (guanine966-N2)-methyltransferase